MARKEKSALNEQDRGELYDRIVKQVEREDNLIDRRVTYTLTFQSIVFAALAFTSRADSNNELAILLKNFAPHFGLGASIFGFFGIFVGFWSIWQKLDSWRTHLKGIEEYPSPTGRGFVLVLAWGSYLCFAAALVYGWCRMYMYLHGSSG